MQSPNTAIPKTTTPDPSFIPKSKKGWLTIAHVDAAATARRAYHHVIAALPCDQFMQPNDHADVTTGLARVVPFALHDP